MKLRYLPFPFSSPGRGCLVVSARRRISLNIQKLINSVKDVIHYVICCFIQSSNMCSFPIHFFGGETCRDTMPMVPDPSGFPDFAMFPSTALCPKSWLRSFLFSQKNNGASTLLQGLLIHKLQKQLKWASKSFPEENHGHGLKEPL